MPPPRWLLAAAAALAVLCVSGEQGSVSQVAVDSLLLLDTPLEGKIAEAESVRRLSAATVCQGQLTDLGNGVCGCNDGADVNGNQCKCTGERNYENEHCKCLGHLSWDAGNGECTCMDGAERNGNNCKCEGGSYNEDEGKCHCPGETAWTGSACACENGNAPTAASLCTGHVCGVGMHEQGGVCVDDNCQGETVWISDTVGCGCINGNTPTANHKCSCKNGAVLNGNQCTCAGGNYHENDETCHCDGQLYWTGSACDCKDGATPSGNQCQCTGGRNYANEQCKCQGQQYWTGTTCGCKDGATASGNQCTCTGGRNYENEQCVCPSGKMYDGTNCVASCYWKPNNQGSVCSWSDFTKTSLKLKDDCNIDSPVSKDNYVADKRNNKYDLAPDSQGHFRAPSADPSITISATKRSSSDQPVSSTSSWLSYVSRPSDLENDVRLPSLGVHDLSIVAKDYRGEAKCFGCVAVQDAFPPTPKSSCGLPDPDYTTQPSVVDYSSTSLQTVLSDETTFNGFFADSNVDNNGQAIPGGDNERCDDKHMISTDFFQTTATTATDFSTCFTNDFVDVMLTSATPTKSSSALSQMVVSGDTTTLQCKRCCSKKVTLQEYYFAYSCSTDTPDRNTQGTASCTYNRCLQIQPPALITATSDIDDDAAGLTTTTIAGLPAGTVGTTGPNYIHRSVTCKAWSEACHVQTTLGGLLTKDANWNTATGFTTSKSASDYVAWVYKIGDDANSAWVAWNDGDSLTFTNEATNVHVEAWTPCGRVLDKTYTFKIHLHSTRDVCKDFALRWTSTPTTRQYPAGDSSTICAYPGSDFALLTFTYNSGDNVPHESGRVKGKYTNIQCDLTVQEHGSTTSVQALDMTSVFGLPSPKPDPFTIAKQFAVELVKDPTTAIDTTVSVNCKFTFQYFDGTAQTTTDDCPASFTFTDCDLPTLETYSSDVACLPDQCGSPTGLPGAFETCDGTVFTTATVGSALQTAIKSTTGGCCTQCSSVLSCVAPEAGVTVKRCEPPLATNLLMALAMDESEVATVVAEEQQQSSTSTMTMLLGASAIVAVVALVVVKTRAAKAKAQTMDDAYMSLLD